MSFDLYKDIFKNLFEKHSNIANTTHKKYD